MKASGKKRNPVPIEQGAGGLQIQGGWRREKSFTSYGIRTCNLITAQTTSPIYLPNFTIKKITFAQWRALVGAVMNIRVIYRLAENRLASQEGLCSVE